MIELASSGAARFVPIDSEKNLVKAGGSPEAVFLHGMMGRAIANTADHPIFLGYVEGTPYFAVDVTGKDVPLQEMGDSSTCARSEGCCSRARARSGLCPRHDLLAPSPPLLRRLRRDHARRQGGHVRICTNDNCKSEHFPRTDPAVIMLVHSGDKCLLGRGKHFPRGMHSTLAGFVEPGESFEDAVAREIYEEVKVKVSAVSYHSSQPWPFPASVMIGFHAEAASAGFRGQQGGARHGALVPAATNCARRTCPRTVPSSCRVAIPSRAG